MYLIQSFTQRLNLCFTMLNRSVHGIDGRLCRGTIESGKLYSATCTERSQWCLFSQNECRKQWIDWFYMLDWTTTSRLSNLVVRLVVRLIGDQREASKEPCSFARLQRNEVTIRWVDILMWRRDKSCSLTIESTSWSGKQCRIRSTMAEWLITSFLGSTTWIFFNGWDRTVCSLSEGGRFLGVGTWRRAVVVDMLLWWRAQLKSWKSRKMMFKSQSVINF